MTRLYDQFVQFMSFATTDRGRPDFTMRWRNGEWRLEAELIDAAPEVSATRVDPPYKFVARTQTRRDRIAKLLDAIEVTHPDDARMVMATCLDKLFWDPPAVGHSSVLEDRKWRAGNVTRPRMYWMRKIAPDDLWSKQGTAAEEDVRTKLLCRIFNSLSPKSKAEIIAAFMRVM